MLRDIIRFLQGWREVWLTNDQTMFYKAKGALVDGDIKSRSSIVRHITRQQGRSIAPRSNANSTYYLFVKAADFHDAKVIIEALKR